MRRVNVLKTSIVTFVGMLLLASPGLQARQLILNSVKITEEGECAVIRVEFGFPVRYISHFPYESGEDLRIQVKPIEVPRGDKEAVFTRESYGPPPNDIASLSDVVYEGNVVGGPFLTLFFRRPVMFKVDKTIDHRSLIIGVHGPKVSKPCPPIR